MIDAITPQNFLSKKSAAEFQENGIYLGGALLLKRPAAETPDPFSSKGKVVSAFGTLVERIEKAGHAAVTMQRFEVDSVARTLSVWNSVRPSALKVGPLVTQ